MKKRLQALGFGLQLELRHVPREILLGILRAYKYVISPLMPPACRYVPTCSEYAAEAIEKHGAIRGVLMGAWRLLRCHPFVKGGFDPVPNPVPGSSRSGRPGPLPRAWTPRAPHSEATH